MMVKTLHSLGSEGVALTSEEWKWKSGCIHVYILRLTGQNPEFACWPVYRLGT